jgi:cytidylate kinase
MVIRDVNELVDLIDAKRQIEAIKIISVDGINGSGKTYLSKILCDKLDISHLNIDEHYVKKNKGSYLDFVEYEKLHKSILKSTNDVKIVLIDAVCVLKILDNISLSSDLKIYVKRLIHGNYWFDGRNMDYTRSVDEVIQEDREQMKNFMELQRNIEGKKQNTNFKYREKSLFHDVLRYHFEYHPDLYSDIIFERLN